MVNPIKVTIKGIETLKNINKKRHQKLTRRRKANAAIVAVVDRWIQKNFQTQGQPVGGWKKLAPSTIRQRRKGKKSHGPVKGGKRGSRRASVRILQDTGQLRSRWKHFYNDKIARVTSGVTYGVYHDSEKLPRRRLPRRQILPDSEHIMPSVHKIYSRFVDGIISHDRR